MIHANLAKQLETYDHLHCSFFKKEKRSISKLSLFTFDGTAIISTTLKHNSLNLLFHYLTQFDPQIRGQTISTTSLSIKHSRTLLPGRATLHGFKLPRCLSWGFLLDGYFFWYFAIMF